MVGDRSLEAGDRAVPDAQPETLHLIDLLVLSGFHDQADLTHRFARPTNENPAQFRAHQRRIAS